ncbi:MAG: NO-inducible flavohemoprotein [Acidibacillus sp.]|uniref:Flavohemoprotein n=1 Tax=Sulfoacidibacillus ferrooxidans TaxID=2005001 RepID=A0A9X1VEY5_9BACL|nr:NO-inducible flavohemoprotein [Sulfoacidibacillus ferrooxidans]MCI0184777.1 Flavohemoprotein [Sulfoacidibacillus ferrooxidans]MCY0894587.1 NO-inducible flavohemoprotein [Acidibacillus sp.]
MLSQATKDIITSTVPVLEIYGERITTRFYERLFQNEPSMLDIFNQTNQRKGQQQTALAQAVYAAALHIEHIEDILPVVKQIGHKHRGLGVTPEHYPIIGENLLGAMKEVLGDGATDEIIGAWAQAYGVIADAFIGVEQDMYAQVATQTGGWEGFRPFIVVKKVQESDVITSFYIEPEDGGTVAVYEPGQYLTLKIDIPGLAHTQRRQYSLSDEPGKPYYRISVKREDAHDGWPEGIVSTYLHHHVQVGDTLHVAAPAGDFTLDVTTHHPIVFLSGGVGMTPLLSMVHSLLTYDPQHEVTYVHAAIHGGVHAFQTEMEELAIAHPSLQYYIVYEKPHEEDKQRAHFAQAGYIDLALLDARVPRDAEFYVCGPKPFMKSMVTSLQQLNVSSDHIHYEFFGPQGSLE